eukprot:2298057-Alexandrium_andersonii.AAC.1
MAPSSPPAAEPGYPGSQPAPQPPQSAYPGPRGPQLQKSRRHLHPAWWGGHAAGAPAAPVGALPRHRPPPYQK